MSPKISDKRIYTWVGLSESFATRNLMVNHLFLTRIAALRYSSCSDRPFEKQSQLIILSDHIFMFPRFIYIYIIYIFLQYLPVLVGFCTHNPCSFVGSKHFTPGYTVASPSPAQEFAAKTRLELTRLKTLQLPGSSLYSSACYLTDAIRTVVACVTRRENPMKHRGFMV